MAWEFFHVFDDEGGSLGPGGTADAATFFDAGAGDGALEGAEYEFVVFDEVEAYPEEVELFFERCSGIGEVCDEVGFAGDERGDLWDEGLVLSCF